MRELAERLRFELLLLRRYRAQDGSAAPAELGVSRMATMADVLAAAAYREAEIVAAPDEPADPSISS